MQLAGCSICAPGELVQDKSSALQPWNLHFQHMKLNLQWRVKELAAPQGSPHAISSKTGVFNLFPALKGSLSPIISKIGVDLQRSQKGFTHSPL